MMRFNKLKFLIVLLYGIFTSSSSFSADGDRKQEDVPSCFFSKGLGTRPAYQEPMEEYSDSDDELLDKAYEEIQAARTDIDKKTAAEALDKIIKDRVDNCNTYEDLMDLGKKIYNDFKDKKRAKDKVLYYLSDHIDEGEFLNLDDLFAELKEMGFEDIIEEIDQKNHKGSGRR